MKQTYKCSVVAAIVLVVLPSVSAHVAEKTSAKLEKSLRAVIEANFSATEAEDLDAGKWSSLQEQHN